MHPMTLFRLSVIGPLISQSGQVHGELSQQLRQLAEQAYAIPGSHRCYLSVKTIESWYYAYLRGGADALAPKRRVDCGQSKIRPELQAAILQAKRDNPKRSLNVLCALMEAQGLAAKGELKRASLHRLLQVHNLSRPVGCASEAQEYRSFVAERAGDIWYSDAMHGPQVPIKGRLRKAYLISFMDDASRLICHSAFCPGETALDVESVLKQALLKRNLPRKLVIDNGAAYRAGSLQGICARLGIQLIYCRPYRPEGKGKLERWHRTLRAQFISELTSAHLCSLDNLNACLWAWIEQCYHRGEHQGLEGLTPLARWQQDLTTMRSLGPFAASLDTLFYHRYTRKVRRDGTVSLWGKRFEVAYELAGRKISLVVEPHEQRVVAVESAQGEPLGQATPLDQVANCHRRRQGETTNQTASVVKANSQHKPNVIELACERYGEQLKLPIEQDDQE